MTLICKNVNKLQLRKFKKKMQNIETIFPFFFIPDMHFQNEKYLNLVFIFFLSLFPSPVDDLQLTCWEYDQRVVPQSWIHQSFCDVGYRFIHGRHHAWKKDQWQ